MLTAHSPCANGDLRQEVTLTRQSPSAPIATPSLDVQDVVPTLYDPGDFAALFHADKDRAIALVVAMTEPQRVRQALAYAAWLDEYGLAIDLDTVLAAWETP
jgi:hypothetical protein